MQSSLLAEHYWKLMTCKLKMLLWKGEWISWRLVEEFRTCTNHQFIVFHKFKSITCQGSKIIKARCSISIFPDMTLYLGFGVRPLKYGDLDIEFEYIDESPS